MSSRPGSPYHPARRDLFTERTVAGGPVTASRITLGTAHRDQARAIRAALRVGGVTGVTGSPTAGKPTRPSWPACRTGRRVPHDGSRPPVVRIDPESGRIDPFRRAEAGLRGEPGVQGSLIEDELAAAAAVPAASLELAGRGRETRPAPYVAEIPAAHVVPALLAAPRVRAAGRRRFRFRRGKSSAGYEGSLLAE